MILAVTSSLDKQHNFIKKIHIVGSRNNWEIRESFAKALGYFALVLVITAFLTPFLMYIHYQDQIQDFKIQSQKKLFTTQNTDATNQDSNQKEASTITNEDYILQKNKIINLEIALNKQKQSFEQLQEKNLNFEKQIEDQSALIIKQTKEISDLKSKITQLSQKSTTQITQKPAQPVVQKNESKNEAVSNLNIEDFYLNNQGNQQAFGFKLKNISNKLQTGLIRILTYRKNQTVDNQKIKFNSSIGQNFAIRRFRSFNIKRPIDKNNPITHIRIIVWNENQKQIIDQLFK